MAHLTISDAARRCGVTRRTIQRAIQAGRLPLTPDHRITLTALAHAGYTLRHDAATTTHGDTSQGHASHAASQDMSQDMWQGLSPLLARLDQVIALLHTLQQTLDQHVAASSHVTPPSDPALALILAWHQEGLSIRKVAARLNAEHIPTRSGTGRWHASNIHRELARLKSTT